MNNNKAVNQYLSKYAEQEIQYASLVNANYENVLVIPAYAEPIDNMQSIILSEAIKESLLIVVIINEPYLELNPLNELLYNKLKNALTHCQSENHATLGELKPTVDLLIIKRLGENGIDKNQGVGLARKIGMDLALALIENGQLQSRFIHTTDADVYLPDDYFHQTTNIRSNCSAALYDFSHVLTEPKLKTATELYDNYLRQFAQQLESAGSPYAYISIGSTMAIEALAYAKVRGMPKRAAGEDFHLLNKLNKIAPVFSMTGSPIEIQARLSQRTPFGTGVALSEILAGKTDKYDLTAHYPKAFMALKYCIQALKTLKAPNQLSIYSALDTIKCPKKEQTNIVDTLTELGFTPTLIKLSQSPHNLNEQLMVWFDGLKTVRFVHMQSASGEQHLSSSNGKVELFRV